MLPSQSSTQLRPHSIMGADVTARPPDEEHAFGHSKAEYFSSGLEGALILIAAAISVAAWDRLLSPQPLEQVGLAGAHACCFSYQWWRRTDPAAGRRLRSITLRADAHHLLTDVDFGWRCVGIAPVQLTAGLFLTLRSRCS